MGILERQGEVRAAVVPNVTKDTLQTKVHEHVEHGAELFTDAWWGYHGLNAEYLHQVIDHAEKYVDGQVHTNGIENFWSLVKRCLKGTYISVEPFHLFRYLDEQVFRYNNRKGLNDGDRFSKVTEQVNGKRLTDAEVTGKAAADGDTTH